MFVSFPLLGHTKQMIALAKELGYGVHTSLLELPHNV